MSLDVDEFIRRFLLHVLPKGFHRIRHYGLLASHVRNDNLSLARTLPGVSNNDPKSTTIVSSGDNDSPCSPYHCPACGAPMLIIPNLRTHTHPHAIYPRSSTPHDQNTQQLTFHRCVDANGGGLLHHSIETPEINTQTPPQHLKSSPSYRHHCPVPNDSGPIPPCFHAAPSRPRPSNRHSSTPRFPSFALIRRPALRSSNLIHFSISRASDYPYKKQTFFHAS